MKFPFQGKEYYINHHLADQLMSLVWNLKNDWDFVITISGDRKVRVGKSVYAMAVCAFLAYLLKRKKMNDDAYGFHTLFFDNKKMMVESQKLPKYSVVHYDEGREGLAANKAMKQFQMDLVDFFTECGQLNHIFVVVAPDWFDLKEDIAVGRSELLLNVYRKEITKDIDFFRDGKRYPITVLQRGHFEFFSKKTKEWLYDDYRNKRKKNYGLVKADFIGDFTNQYPLDEVQYKQLKSDALERFKERHEEQAKEDKHFKLWKIWVHKMFERGKKPNDIALMSADLFEKEVTADYIRRVLGGVQNKKDSGKDYLVEPMDSGDNLEMPG